MTDATNNTPSAERSNTPAELPAERKGTIKITFRRSTCECSSCAIPFDSPLTVQSHQELITKLQGYALRNLEALPIADPIEPNGQWTAEVQLINQMVADSKSFGATVDDAWKSREIQRLEEQRLPEGILPEDQSETLRLHFVHTPIATPSDPSMVAYTESEHKGRANKQTVVKLGRYLKRFYPEMPDSDIQDRVNRYLAATGKAPAKLVFYTSESDINRIFETRSYAEGGSSCSCMYGKFSGWSNRPYHIYAESPDVAVAALVEDATNTLLARTVVNTLDNTYIRLYSMTPNKPALCTQLKMALKGAGYDEQGSLKGCKVRALYENGKLIGPYVDAGGTLVWEDPEKTWLRFKDGGKIYSNNTDGYMEGEGLGNTNDYDDEEEHAGEAYCDVCERWQDSDCVSYCEESNENACDGCVDDYFVWVIVNNRGNLALYRSDSSRVSMACDENFYRVTRLHDSGLFQQDGDGGWHVEDCGCEVVEQHEGCDGEIYYVVSGDITEKDYTGNSAGSYWHVDGCTCDDPNFQGDDDDDSPSVDESIDNPIDLDPMVDPSVLLPRPGEIVTATFTRNEGVILADEVMF